MQIEKHMHELSRCNVALLMENCHYLSFNVAVFDKTQQGSFLGICRVFYGCKGSESPM